MTDVLTVPMEYSINVNVTRQEPGKPVPNSSNIALITTDPTTITETYGAFIDVDSALKVVNADTLTAKMITALFNPNATFRNNDGQLFIIPISPNRTIVNTVYTVQSTSVTAYTLVEGTQDEEVPEGVQLYSDINCTEEYIVTEADNGFIYNGESTSISTLVPTLQQASDYIALINQIKQTTPQFGVLIDVMDLEFDMTDFYNYIDTQNFLYGQDVEEFANIDLSAYKHVEGVYAGNDLAINKQVIAAYVSVGTSANWDGTNTALTMNLKTLGSIAAPGEIDVTTLNMLKEKGISAYALTAGDSVVYSHRNAGGYWDDKIGDIALKMQIQTNLYNLAKNIDTKIPQNEDGATMVRNAAGMAWQKFLDNGFLTKGIEWKGQSTFGDKETFLRSIVENGYYQYNKPLSQQTPAERASRKITIQGAGQSAGAIHFVTYNATLA